MLTDNRVVLRSVGEAVIYLACGSWVYEQACNFFILDVLQIWPGRCTDCKSLGETHFDCKNFHPPNTQCFTEIGVLG